MSDPILSRLYSLCLAASTSATARQSATLLLRDYAERHALVLSDSDKIPRLSIENARLAVVDAAHAFVTRPCSSTYSRLHYTLFAPDRAILSESDKIPARLLNPDIHAPEVPDFHIQRIAPDALQWQTRPAIGINPFLVAMLQQECDNHDSRKRERDAHRRAARVQVVKPALDPVKLTALLDRFS